MEKFKGVGVNPELPVVLVISILLILGGIIVLHFDNGQQFNFHSSKIIINGTNVKEELNFNANKPYHTLYRNFASQIYSESNLNINAMNYITIKSVDCSAGNSYLKEWGGECYSQGQISSCYSYTESNEYGCTFGDTLGFSKGNEYIINSEYEIHPQNLFKANNNYYIKFVVYSPNNHIRLNTKNFVVVGDVVKKDTYFSNQNVILYIPYKGDVTRFSIIELKNFQFDSLGLLAIFLAILPGILFFLAWLILGKERVYEETPKELSEFPNKRKFWEVSTYFNPPFFNIGKNFFASILLNFYSNKVIDVIDKDKDIFIKLNKFKGDETEKKVYDILEFIWLNIRRDKDKKFLYGDYFNLKGFMNTFYYRYSVSKLILDKYKDLKKGVEEEGKKYVEKNFTTAASYISYIFIGIFLFTSNIISEKVFFIYILAFFLWNIFLFSGAIFVRFNGEYYIEYQRWKAFKRYLKNSFSISTATHKTVVIWNEYLIYATALGVPEKVIKELQASNLINDRQVNIYNGIIINSSFASGGAGGGASGGGFGGAGGGGVGGGGGGGR